MAPHRLVSVVGNLGVLTDVFQVRADKTEGFVFGPSLDLVDPGDGFLVHDIAADTIQCISGVGDNTTPAEDLHNLIDFTLLRIMRIDFKQHRLIAFKNSFAIEYHSFIAVKSFHLGFGFCDLTRLAAFVTGIMINLINGTASIRSPVQYMVRG